MNTNTPSGRLQPMTEKVKNRTWISNTLLVGLVLAAIGGIITFYRVPQLGGLFLFAGAVVAIIGLALQLNRRR